jgi:hypothetical protein
MIYIIGPSLLVIFFLRHLFFLYTFKPPAESIAIDPVEAYILKQKQKLLGTYKNGKDMSANIEKTFYNKKDYTAVMKVANNEIETAWKTRILHESTPKGIIIMFYDAYKQAFSYYADQNSIPISLINAVAMKYVTIFFCRDFYFNEETFLEQLEIENEETNKTDEKPPIELTMIEGTHLSPLIKIHNESEKTKEKDAIKKIITDAPFAKFKNNTTERRKDAEKKKKPNEIQRYFNNYVCLGKTYNLTVLQKNSKSGSNTTTGYDNMFAKSKESIIGTKLSYKDFKKRADNS